MKLSLKFLVVSLIVFSSLLSFANTESKPEQITIGFIPGGDPALLKKQSLELAQILQNNLNISINVYISKNYAGLVEAMKQKKIDFAFYSALTFVQAEKQAQAKVLLKKMWDNEPFYYATLISRADSKIKNLQTVRNLKIAFVDENSSSGFFYPNAYLKKNNISLKDFAQVIYSGNHQSSLQLLDQKKVDLVATFSDDAKGKFGAWNKFNTPNLKVRPLWVSDPIPNDPFCVRQDFYDKYPKVTHDLMFALVDLMSDQKNIDKFAEALGSKQLVPATSKQFEPVREIVQLIEKK